MKVPLIEVLEDEPVSIVAKAKILSQIELPQVEWHELWIYGSLL